MADLIFSLSLISLMEGGSKFHSISVLGMNEHLKQFLLVASCIGYVPCLDERWTGLGSWGSFALGWRGCRLQLDGK